jgi:hypothetical protein
MLFVIYLSRASEASSADWKTTKAYSFLNFSFLLMLIEVIVPYLEKISLRSLYVFLLEFYDSRLLT